MAKKRNRVETDSLGEVKIPFNALWGPQTQRAVDNFLSAELLSIYLSLELLSWPWGL